MKNVFRYFFSPYINLALSGLFVASICGILFGTLHVAASKQLDASGTRLLNVYDNGMEQGIITKDTTLRQAFKDAGIQVSSSDLIHPSLDQKLVANNYDVNIYRARPVLIVDGSIQDRVMTPYQTADQILSHAGFTLHDEDQTSITQASDFITQGAAQVLTIKRATPINIELYGTTIGSYTQATTVGALLKEKNIKLGASDTISVPQTTPITAGMTVSIWRNGTQTVTEQQMIPFTTQQIQDTDQPVGYTAIQTPGVNGTETVSYSVVMQNGQVVSKTQIQAVVTQQPVTQVEVVGAKLQASAGYSAESQQIMAQAGIPAGDYSSAAYIVDHENGLWCPTRWQGESGCTAGYDPLYAPGAQVGYGLCQATPGDKMASAGSDWETNPVTQMIWCTSYANSRYGGWGPAAAHWAAYHSW